MVDALVADITILLILMAAVVATDIIFLKIHFDKMITCMHRIVMGFEKR